MSQSNTEIKITTEDTQLSSSGFTDSGIARFKKTTSDYAQLLFNKAIAFGSAKTTKDYKLEITQEDIQASAHSIADSFGKPEEPKWTVWAQVFEYLLTAFAGYCAGKTDVKWGLIGFILATALVVILFVTRQTKRK